MWWNKKKSTRNCSTGQKFLSFFFIFLSIAKHCKNIEKHFKTFTKKMQCFWCFSDWLVPTFQFLSRHFSAKSKFSSRCTINNSIWRRKKNRWKKNLNSLFCHLFFLSFFSAYKFKLNATGNIWQHKKNSFWFVPLTVIISRWKIKIGTKIPSQSSF